MIERATPHHTLEQMPDRTFHAIRHRMHRMMGRFTQIGCLGLCAALAACASPGRDPASEARIDSPVFADAINLPGGVPCRFDGPAYTAEQSRMGLRGRVQVAYVVNTIGRIDIVNIERSSGNGDLDQAARTAVEHATCAPYVVSGTAHRVLQRTVFNFEPRAVSAPVASQTPLAAAPFNIPSESLAARPAGTLASAPANPADFMFLAQAIQAAYFQKMGISPNSTKAAILRRWGQRIQTDPDVARVLGRDAQHPLAGSLTPMARARLYADGVLRLSPDERSTLNELTLRALDNAPANCGGVKNTAAVLSRYTAIGTMSDEELDNYLGIAFKIYKNTALGVPMAQITPAQRAEGLNATLRTFKETLKNDPTATRNFAAAVVDPAGVSPEIWCSNARAFGHALQATPQPFRDWALLSAETALSQRLQAMPQ
jgi:TonB family protein